MPPVRCRNPAPHINAANPPQAPPGMVWVPGGTFWMGCSDARMATPSRCTSSRRRLLDGCGAGPKRISGSSCGPPLRHDRRAAARKPRQFPGVPVSKLVPDRPCSCARSRRFARQPVQLAVRQRASWRRPEGATARWRARRSSGRSRGWDRRVEYLKWAGKRLPTEAQFEFAERAVDRSEPFAWATISIRTDARGEHLAGTLPRANTVRGSRGPRGHGIPANGSGVRHGRNVWQWCADWYRPDYYGTMPPIAREPQGPSDSSIL